jgi:hypothetical protein
MIIIQKRSVHLGECWFSEEAGNEPVDLLRYKQRPEPGARGRWEKFSTLVVDLTLPEEEIIAGFDKTTAYQVRRSEANWMTEPWTPIPLRGSSC